MTGQNQIAEVSRMTAEEVAQQVGTLSPDQAGQDASPEIRERARVLLERIQAVDERDIDGRRRVSDETRQLGSEVRRKIAHQSELLNAPVSDIMAQNDANGDVGGNLLALRRQVEDINPNGFDFSESGFRRLLSKLPGIGTKLEAWWSRYQSVSTVINDILRNLETGKQALHRDNETLRDDRDQLLKYTWELQDQLQLAMVLDTELTTWLETLAEEQKKIIQEDFLYYLRQEVQDMQLSLGAANQAILVSDIIRRANQELIRSTDRTLNVSANALQTAAALQVALAHQKKQLDAVKATQDMTVDLLKSTARTANTQGVEVVRSANDVDSMIAGLKEAFGETLEAMNALDAYKQEALPAMKNNIQTLDSLNQQMKTQVERSSNAKSEGR